MTLKHTNCFTLSCVKFTLKGFVLQGAVSGCHGWSASLWPRSSYSQVVRQKCRRVAELERFLVNNTMLRVCVSSGRRVGGQTALEMGLVNRAMEQNQTGDAAYKEALTLAREILPQVGARFVHF